MNKISFNFHVAGLVISVGDLNILSFELFFSHFLKKEINPLQANVPFLHPWEHWPEMG